MPRAFLVPALLLAAVYLRPEATQVHSPPRLEERFRAPGGTRWGYFENADRARIRYSRLSEGAGAKAAIVLIPGYSEFAEKYFELMRELAARGYEVWQMDWRGYGGSDRYLAEREKGHSRGVDLDTRDLDQFVRTIVKPAPGRPLVLIAHSMGAQFGLRYLHDHPDRFDAAVLSSPFLSLAGQGMPDWLVRAIVWSADSFGLREKWAMGNRPWLDKPGERMSHDPVRNEVQWRWNQANPVLRTGGVTYGWVRAQLRSFDVMNQPGYWSAIRLPVLLGSASGDVLTRPDVHAAACSRMPNCKLVRLEEAWHELFMESDAYRSRWLGEVFRFLDSTSARR